MSEAVTGQAAAPARKRVLVVDDDDEVRAVFSEFLHDHGFDVVEATNGLEALLRVKRAKPSVVVLDVMMPRLGGVDALKRIHAFDPGMALVVVTGQADQDLQRQALALGAAAVLTKPVALADLLAAIDNPRTRRSAPPETDRAARSAPPDGVGQVSPPVRVLVVDDDQEIRDLLAEFLTENGYETRFAIDGAGGVRAVLEDAPDIALLDIQMPGLSGINALKAIRSVAPETTIIMISGTQNEDLSRLALAYGAFDYVTKPIDFPYLTRTLETAVVMKRLE